MLLFSLKLSHPVDDLRLCEPVVQVMAELLKGHQLPAIEKGQGEADKDEKGPRIVKLKLGKLLAN